MKLRIFYYTVITLITFPCSVFANAGLPIITYGEPFMVICFIPIVIIETIVYMFRLKKKFKESLKNTIIVNLHTTIIGYPLSWFYLFLYQFIVSIIIGIILFPLKRIMPEFETNHAINLIMLSVFAPAWLLPNQYPAQILACMAGITGLIPCYYVTVKLEYDLLGKRWGYSDDLKSACILANRITYGLLLAVLFCSTIFFSTTYQR